MQTNPTGFSPSEDTIDDHEATKAIILSVLHAKEKNENFDAHGFPWESEKEVRELSREGLVYLNRQTANGIYAKLTDRGRKTSWVDYASPGSQETVKKSPLPPKARTMREILLEGWSEEGRGDG